MVKDNSSRRLKAKLRQRALAELDTPPVVLETHGGWGVLFDDCYYSVPTGCVFEKDGQKAAALAKQRPTWAVYEVDCVMALQHGIGGHLGVNLLDLDPYGQPWPALEAFFMSRRPRAERLSVVVNDGLRRALKSGSISDAIRPVVDRYGIVTVRTNYLEVCRELMQEKARLAGYREAGWVGYYTGPTQELAHYYARLERE